MEPRCLSLNLHCSVSLCLFFPFHSLFSVIPYQSLSFLSLVLFQCEHLFSARPTLKCTSLYSDGFMKRRFKRSHVKIDLQGRERRQRRGRVRIQRRTKKLHIWKHPRFLFSFSISIDVKPNIHILGKCKYAEHALNTLMILSPKCTVCSYVHLQWLSR